MVRRLHQTNSRELLLHRSRDYGLHQLASHAAVLCAGVNRDRSHTSNGRSLIQAVASDDFAVLFSHHAEEQWVRKHHREHMYGNLRGWKIAREIVFFGECAKGFETDSSAHFRVGWSGTANDKGLFFGDPRLRLRCHDDCLLPRSVIPRTCGSAPPLGEDSGRNVRDVLEAKSTSTTRHHSAESANPYQLEPLRGVILRHLKRLRAATPSLAAFRPCFASAEDGQPVYLLRLSLTTNKARSRNVEGMVKSGAGRGVRIDWFQLYVKISRLATSHLSDSTHAAAKQTVPTA